MGKCRESMVREEPQWGFGRLSFVQRLAGGVLAGRGPSAGTCGQDAYFWRGPWGFPMLREVIVSLWRAPWPILLVVLLC